MEFLQALSVQGRVISALTLHETRSRYGDSKLGFFWALFEPAAHIAVFMIIFSSAKRTTPVGDSIAVFLLTGIIPWLLYNNTVSQVMIGLTANKALLSYPQVMPIDITISRVLLEFSSLFLVMMFFLLMAIYLGTDIKFDNFLVMMQAVGLFLMLGAGVGMINAAIIHSIPSYKNIYRAISRPIYFMSGVFFTADFLSSEIFAILYYNPLLHLMEWFRTGFFTSFNSTLYDPEYAATFCIIVFTIGLIVERATRKKARII